MEPSVVLTCVLIAMARITDITLDTIRTVFIVQGRRGMAAVLGFFEALIFVCAVAKVLQNLDHPVYFVAHAGGFAAGTYLGITIEQRLAFGRLLLSVFSRRGSEMAAVLRAEGYRVTEFAGEGRDGTVAMLYIETARRQAETRVACVLAIWNARVAAPAPAAAPAAAPASETDPSPATAAAAPPTLEMRTLWLALPAAASALMLAITNQMCQEIAAIPFLWLLPFSLYLLSFILCFESDRWYRRSRYMIALALAFVGLYYALTQMHALRPSVGIALYSAGLFVCCMFCHGELAHLRPPARHLTSFYLMCALGGALGGVFVALVAPRIFKLFFEVQGAMLVCALLAAPDVTGRYHGPVRRQGRALRLAAMVAFIVVLLSVQMYYSTQSARVLVRNFYGTLRVDEVDAESGGGRLRKMVHGTTIHGQEYVAPPQPHRPLGYFGPGSGIHLALTQLRPDAPRRVGILGLGVGTLAAYGRPGDVYRFYEINPLVIDLAQREFDYLGACAAKVELLLGDARLVLERERPQAYDVLVADAFSSDSIPLHLVTRESFALYLSHLKPDGLLACNISNRYLDMRPVLVQLARAHGLSARYVFDEGNPPQGTMSSTWVLLARDGGFFERPEVKRVALPLDDVRQDLRLWTDDYSNLFQILR